MVNILNVFLFKITGHRLLVTILCVSADCQEQFTDINQKMPTFALQKECGARTDFCLLLHHIIWLFTSLCPNILKQLPVYLKKNLGHDLILHSFHILSIFQGSNCYTCQKVSNYPPGISIAFLVFALLTFKIFLLTLGHTMWSFSFCICIVYFCLPLNLTRMKKLFQMVSRNVSNVQQYQNLGFNSLF